MSRTEYWELIPEDFMHPLGDAEHAPFLIHYGRIRTLDEWVSAGFEVGYNKGIGITKRKEENLYRFSRVRGKTTEQEEAITTGRRHVTHFFPMLDYVRAGVPFTDFISHPAHFEFFCMASLAAEAGEIDAAIEGFRQALEDEPSEVRYAERFYRMRISNGDITAPTEELTYFSNEIDSMIHTGRVYEWINLLISHEIFEEAATVLRRTAQLLEDKLAGRLPKGRYSGESDSFITSKRDQFLKKVQAWRGMRKYQSLMTEVDRQGGMPQRSEEAA